MNSMNLDSLPHWSFGDSPEMANDLVQLVLDGKKTATCTALEWHLKDDNPALVGGLEVIVDGQGRPRCVIQNTAQHIVRFCDVDETLAEKEGEGDLSLAYWQQAHQEFFERFGVFDTQMQLLFQQFKVVQVL